MASYRNPTELFLVLGSCRSSSARSLFFLSFFHPSFQLHLISKTILFTESSSTSLRSPCNNESNELESTRISRWCPKNHWASWRILPLPSPPPPSQRRFSWENEVGWTDMNWSIINTIYWTWLKFGWLKNEGKEEQERQSKKGGGGGGGRRRGGWQLIKVDTIIKSFDWSDMDQLKANLCRCLEQLLIRLWC